MVPLCIILIMEVYIITEEKEMYSVSETSEIAGITSPRLMRRIRNGTIQAKKVGWVWVIPKSEVDKVVEEMRLEKEKGNEE